VAAHDFDKDVNIVAFGQGNRVGFPSVARQIGVAVFRFIAGGNGGDHHRTAGAQGDQIGVLLHDLDHTDSNGAKTRKTQAQRFGCHGKAPFVIHARLLADGCAGCNALADLLVAQSVGTGLKAGHFGGKRVGGGGLIGWDDQLIGGQQAWRGQVGFADRIHFGELRAGGKA
jgi:hypothetical protein